MFVTYLFSGKAERREHEALAQVRDSIQMVENALLEKDEVCDRKRGFYEKLYFEFHNISICSFIVDCASLAHIQTSWTMLVPTIMSFT